MIRKIADKLFKWYCNPEYYPDIQGDLEELYSDHKIESPKWANLKYLADVILLFRPALIRPIIKVKNSIINSAMFKNYFKISIRNLMRHKVYTGINVIGLAIGLAGFLLISEYVNFEKSYDQFHPDPERLYRISNLFIGDGGSETRDAMASYSAGKLLEDEIPEVTSHTVSKKIRRMILRNGPSTYIETGAVSADDYFFDHFNYEILQGDKENFFKDPMNIVLTESKAKAYFGDDNALGQTLEVLSPYEGSFKVTGVIKDIPVNTHYSFDMLVSDLVLKNTSDDYQNWNYNNYYVYIKIQEGTNMTQLEEKVHAAAIKQLGEDTNEFFELNKVTDIYLNSIYTYEPQIMGSSKAVTFLSIISIFILVIAWVNYVNLSTARAVDRAKEVGLRKVVGAVRRQLILQFLFESFFINLLGATLALVMAQLALPYFNILVGKVLVTDLWNYWPFLRALILFTIAGSAISGLYPAFVLSSFKPVTVLKGKFRNSKQGVLLRKGLVVVQFTASIVLIASTMIVYSQVQYMKDKDLGIDTNYVVSLTIPKPKPNDDYQSFKTRMNTFKNNLRKYTYIQKVGGTSNLPGGQSDDINATSNPIRVGEGAEKIEGTTYLQWNDSEFQEAVGMRLITGRNFDPDIKSDSTAVIVNQSFLKRHRVNEEDAVGKSVYTGAQDSKLTIIGVVQDWNRTSLKTEVEPSMYLHWENPRKLAIKLDEKNYKEALSYIDEQWDGFFPLVPLNYTFLDERFEALYNEDQKFGNVFAVFSAFAILVATLGLFGLASFLALQRTKEVGIRKVLGAEVNQIIGIFYKDFIWLLGIASVIGVPLIYFSMDQWLSNYAYRISFPWFLTISAIFVVAVFALTTVGYQIYRVAVVSPSKTLKYE